MNDAELKAQIDILHHIDKDIKINFSRDKSGNIKTLSSSGGRSRGFCKSDDFEFIIVILKDKHWKGCMISGRK